MSKHKGKLKPAQLSTRSTPADTARSESSTQTPVAPERHWRNFLALAVIVAFVGLAYVMTPSSQKLPPKSKAEQNLNSAAAAFTPRNACKVPPVFMRDLSANHGFGAGSALSTSERDLLGLAVVDFDPQSGKRLREWQHPSWRTAGNLSAFALDQRGDIYVIPAPRVNLLDNPPAQQNRLYRIDGNTGAMTLVLEFPVASAVDQRNPYAGLGLSYDCALDSLFLTSVAGSTPSVQRGLVFRIALRPSVKVASTLTGVDMFAVSSVGKSNQVALLLGSARSADIMQINLDADGNFPANARPTKLLSIAGRGPEGNDRARKIDVGTDGTLIVRGTRFAYNLAQPSSQEHATRYIFAFDANTQSYQFQRWAK